MENKLTAVELRIGNLIQTDYEGVMEVVNINSERIEYIDAKKLNYRAIGRFELAFVEPIPLTEEWLLEFGFIPNKYQDEFSLDLITLDCEYTDKGIFNLSIGEFKSEIEIKHLHQLQNIYFALTNKELTIK